jgi:hypothetical protein
VWELNDPEVKRKIERFARQAEFVRWSGSAQCDIANTSGATSAGVLAGILDHLSCDFPVFADHMKNGDVAFILHCFVGPGRLYVKTKLITLGAEELMLVFSAHKNR